MDGVATVLFVLSFLFINVEYSGKSLLLLPLYKIELAVNLGLAVIAYGMRLPSVQQTRRLVGVLGVLAIVQFVYFLGLNTYPLEGSLVEYVSASVRVFGYLVSVTTYATLFFDEELLMETFYKVGRAVLTVGVGALLVYEIVGIPLLLDFAYKEPRTQSFFTEPSATAPAVAVVGTMAWRRRDWFGGLLALTYVYTANSPTVILVFVLSIIGIYLVQRGPVALWTGVLGSIGSAVAFVTFGGLNWLKTAPYFGKTVNRLARGVEFAITLSQQGYNPRFAGAINVYEQLQKNGLLWIGYGLNSASPYFRHVTLDTITKTQDYSLLLTLLFSFGIIGVAIFLIYCYLAAMGMYRHSSRMSYIFVPFFLTSMINSAQGFVTYKFVILGIVVYGIGNRLTYEAKTEQT